LATFVVEMVGEGFQRNRQKETRRPLLLSHFGSSQSDWEQGPLFGGTDAAE